MNYQVLARKWRPQKFSDVIGQKHVVTAIVHSFLLRKIHHAYILIGTRGVGKTTIARLFAKALNCTNSQQEANSIICGICKNCQNITLNRFVDLIEIDAASHSKVEETREFLDNVQYMPSIGNFKIYLIDEAHMLSKHSFNALLKILEEPPVHVKFILVTTEYRKIPKTILSRCLQFCLQPLNINQIVYQLTHIFNEENIAAEKMAVESLAYAAKGSMRDALNLAEQAIVIGNKKITSDIVNNMFGVINMEYPLCLIENLIDGNIHNILQKIENYSILGINWDCLLTEMLTILKEITIKKFLCNSLVMTKNNMLVTNITKRIYILNNRITAENAQSYYKILLLGRRELPYAPDGRIGIEMIMLRALAFKIKVDKNNNGVKKSNMLPAIVKNSNFNTVQSTTVNNSIYRNNNDLLYIEKFKNVNDNSLFLSVKNKNTNLINIKSNNVLSVSTDKKNLLNSTDKLIKIRLMLLKYKKNSILNNAKNMSNLNINSQKKTTINILKRFCNINNSNTISYISNTEKHSKNFLQSNSQSRIHTKGKKIISNFMQEILQQAMKNDPWMCQIYNLSLSKTAKKLAMNSWKEDITTKKICLHVRSDYYYLCSTTLNRIIQQSLSKYTGNLMTLYIKKDDNYHIKNTPMEYIRVLYKKKLLKIKQEFMEDPYVKIIKKFFDADFDENDIKIL